MNRNSLIVLRLIVILLLFSSLAIALESIQYDFDEVDVIYAAEFTTRSTNISSDFTVNSTNISSDNWLTQLAGGANKPINVTYGIVNLIKSGQIQIVEEFIKVNGEMGSERFLVNSVSYDYYEGTTNYRDIKSFFWSAKRLVDNSVVKDFTPPIKSITLQRRFDESQNLYSIVLSVNEGEKEEISQSFWLSILSRNLYEADLGSLIQYGDPRVRSS